MMKTHFDVSIRALASRTIAPRESLPSCDPPPFTNRPFPTEVWPDQWASALVRRDQVLVARFRTASPLAPQLCWWKVTPSQEEPAPPSMEWMPSVCPAADVGQFGSLWETPLIVLLGTLMNLLFEVLDGSTQKISV